MEDTYAHSPCQYSTYGSLDTCILTIVDEIVFLSYKKVSVLFLSIFISLIVYRQTNTSAFDKFYSEFSRLERVYRNHYDNKEYDKTVKSLEESLSLINEVNCPCSRRICIEFA